MVCPSSSFIKLYLVPQCFLTTCFSSSETTITLKLVLLIVGNVFVAHLHVCIHQYLTAVCLLYNFSWIGSLSTEPRANRFALFNILLGFIQIDLVSWFFLLALLPRGTNLTSLWLKGIIFSRNHQEKAWNHSDLLSSIFQSLACISQCWRCRQGCNGPWRISRIISLAVLSSRAVVSCHSNAETL